MREFLEMQIATRRQRLGALDQQRSKLLAELKVYEETMSHLTGVTSPSHDLDGGTGGSERAQLNISRAWIAILKRLSAYKSFNASDVMVVARELYKDDVIQKPQTTDGIRAQLSLYNKKKIIQRRGAGNYLVSERTKVALANELNERKFRDAVSKTVRARATGRGPETADDAR